MVASPSALDSVNGEFGYGPEGNTSSRWNLESARAELENTEKELSWALEIPNVPSVKARTCLWGYAPDALCGQAKTASLTVEKPVVTCFLFSLVTVL